MKKIMLAVDDYLYAFYQKVGENAGGLEAEKVMADALFTLAGELSLNVISRKGVKNVEES